MPDVIVRAARPADAAAVAETYLRSRRELVACAPLAHPDADVRDWIRDHLLPAGRTTVAFMRAQLVGFVSTERNADAGWISQLYLSPDWIGRGIGLTLLDHARATLLPPVRLYTFADNHLARRFYERHGFRAIAVSDGSGNEECCPDVLYEWTP
jgi:ribosomal protein S18 acetylase RimI-like enzyme